jgi:hypothetical protein
VPVFVPRIAHEQDAVFARRHANLGVLIGQLTVWRWFGSSREDAALFQDSPMGHRLAF